MKRIDPTVKKECAYMAAIILILSVLMQAGFLVVGAWDYTVLLGNLLGAAGAMLNFFLLGLTVQSATAKEEKSAKATMQLSQSLRLLMLFGMATCGVLLSCFHTVAVLLPLLFPRIAVFIRTAMLKKESGNDHHEPETNEVIKPK